MFRKLTVALAALALGVAFATPFSLDTDGGDEPDVVRSSWG